jgi:hypothetical protein
VSPLNFLITTYNGFVSIFPGPLQWLVTLLILVGLVTALIVLVRHHILFLIVAVVLLPFVVPVVARFVSDIYQAILYLLVLLHLVPSQ